MQIHNYCKAGGFHRELGGECQDENLSATVGSYDIAVQADGVSGCSHGKRGAQIACEAVVDFVRLEKENVFLYVPRKLSFLMIEHILYFLEIESRKNGTDISDYSSTVAFTCVNNYTGEMLVFSLGDGAVFRSSGIQVRASLSPKRFCGNPFLTTTDGAYKYAEIKKQTLSRGDSVLLCTDGFLHAVDSSASGFSVLQNAMLSKDFSKLDTLLNSADESDDIGYIHYTRTRR